MLRSRSLQNGKLDYQCKRDTLPFQTIEEVGGKCLQAIRVQFEDFDRRLDLVRERRKTIVGEKDAAEGGSSEETGGEEA